MEYTLLTQTEWDWIVELLGWDKEKFERLGFKIQPQTVTIKSEVMEVKRNGEVPYSKD